MYQRAKVCFAVRRNHEPRYTEVAGFQDQTCHEEVSYFVTVYKKNVD